MEPSSNLEALSHIIALTHRFQKVKRLVYATGEDRFENNAEHSFQLALTAWYLIEKENLPLNREKVLLYALCHDLVEVYAGDVSFYRTKEEDKIKIIKEEAALESLEKDYASFPTLTETIRAYESKNDEESKFIYALDKILPMINIQLDNGRSWHLHNVSFEQLHEGKCEKVAHDPVVKKYFSLIAEVLRESPHLFPSKK